MSNMRRDLMTTASSLAIAAALTLPVASPHGTIGTARPIDRLSSIRDAYLSDLEHRTPGTTDLAGQQVAQFPNFPNFGNWRNR
jgi:hypothetical protein